MPTYEYVCPSCGEHLEVVQSFTDDPLTECPHCGGPLRKVFGNIGIVLKGSGFYKTDSRPAVKTGGGSKDGGDGSPKEATVAKDSAAGSGDSGSGTGGGDTAKADTPKKATTEGTKAATS